MLWTHLVYVVDYLTYVVDYLIYVVDICCGLLVICCGLLDICCGLLCICCGLLDIYVADYFDICCGLLDTVYVVGNSQYMYSNIKEKLIKYKVDSKWVYTHEYFI